MESTTTTSSTSVIIQPHGESKHGEIIDSKRYYKFLCHAPPTLKFMFVGDNRHAIIYSEKVDWDGNIVEGYIDPLVKHIEKGKCYAEQDIQIKKGKWYTDDFHVPESKVYRRKDRGSPDAMRCWPGCKFDWRCVPITIPSHIPTDEIVDYMINACQMAAIILDSRDYFGNTYTVNSKDVFATCANSRNDEDGTIIIYPMDHTITDGGVRDWIINEYYDDDYDLYEKNRHNFAVDNIEKAHVYFSPLNGKFNRVPCMLGYELLDWTDE